MHTANHCLGSGAGKQFGFECNNSTVAASVSAGFFGVGIDPGNVERVNESHNSGRVSSVAICIHSERSRQTLEVDLVTHTPKVLTNG